MSPSPPRPSRFGVFELDTAAGELRKHGVRIKLHDKPFQILVALLERPGQVVTRQELQQRLWPGDTFVEFENGLNNAISRLREALGDSADSPRYIETLPKRGYRLLVPAEPLLVQTPQPATALSSPRAAWRWAIAGLVLAVAAASVIGYHWVQLAPVQSIAVLPFVSANTPEGSSDEYIAFGMTEAMITELSRRGELKVISQTSVLQYKSARKPLPQIARELGVGAILEGSVVREGEQVRITVQLIDARSDTHLWAQTYRRSAATVLAQQTELAQTIVRDIGGGLLPGPSPPPPVPSPLNAQAQEAYLKGRYFLQKSGKERDKALDYLEQALAADPDAPRTLSALADYYLLADSVPPTLGMPKAREYAQKALARNETLADAHLSLGFVHFYGDWDWPSAEREFRRALELDPSLARAHRWYALYLSAMGRHDEAGTHIEKALQLDPISIATREAAGAVWVNGRKYDLVLEQGRRILELDADDPRGFECLVNGYAFSGSFERALEEVSNALAASKEYPAYFYLQGFVHGLAGNQKAAQASLNEARRSAAHDYIPGTFLAVVYGVIGQRDAAFRHLEEAFRTRDSFLVTLKVAPYFDPLRDDLRFQDLLRRMKLP